MTWLLVWCIRLAMTALFITMLTYIPYQAFNGSSYINVMIMIAVTGLPMTMLYGWQRELVRDMPLKPRRQKKKRTQTAEAAPTPRQLAPEPAQPKVVRRRVRRRVEPPIVTVAAARHGDSDAHDTHHYLEPGLRDLVSEGEWEVQNDTH